MDAAANRFDGATLTKRMGATATDIEKLNCVNARMKRKRQSYERLSSQKPYTDVKWLLPMKGH